MSRHFQSFFFSVFFICLYFISTQNAWAVPGSLSGTMSDDQISRAFSADINGDGQLDLIVCSPWIDSSTISDVGGVFIFTNHVVSSYSDTISNADVSIYGDTEGSLFGYSCDNAGDVNNDGYDDILIGAPQDLTQNAYTGATYLLFGASQLSGSTLADFTTVRFHGARGGDEAGYSVAGIGDIDGDGYDDILIGAPGYDGGIQDAGGAYLIHGSSSLADMSLSNSSILLFQGQSSGDAAGRVVGSAGDINCDGQPDFFISSPFNTTGNGSGSVYVVLGPGPSASAMLSASTSVKFIGESNGDLFGLSVAGGGNADATGCSDLIIGAPRRDSNGSDSGSVYIYLGGSSALTYGNVIMSSANRIKKINGAAAGDTLGTAVAFAGQLDSDSYDDIVLGASMGAWGPGKAYIVFGRSSFSNTSTLANSGTGAINRRINYSLSTVGMSQLGLDVSGLGDYDGDGYNEFSIGAPLSNGSYYGRIYLQERRIKPSGIVSVTLP